MSKTFVGSRVRQLRSERGFSQAALAQMLEISPSYLNQIEHDVRPLTVAVLLRITEVFGVDATFFASQDDTRLVAELREVTMDRDLDIDVDPPEVAEMVQRYIPAPGPRCEVNLHRRYRITTAQPSAAATEERLLRRQRQRVDHHAARRGARLLLRTPELPARVGQRRRRPDESDAAAPRRPGARADATAHRGARRADQPGGSDLGDSIASLRPQDQGAGNQQSPRRPGQQAPQDGRRVEPTWSTAS